MMETRTEDDVTLKQYLWQGAVL